MIINANTKIAALLKAHPGSLDAIVSITPKFEKLRNPLLRKLMAGRTSIAMAAKISGCGVNAFYEKLRPLGFEIDDTVAAEAVKSHPVPAFLHKVREENIVSLDVRPIIEGGQDPLKNIMDAVKQVPVGGALKVINSFEPTPLIKLLEKQGYASFVDNVSEDTIETWFYKEIEGTINIPEGAANSEDWDAVMERYSGKMTDVDVRELQMPLPMHTILESIETLPADKALFVYHKRIPVFLLPELKERGFDYRIKEISDGQVRLLIFKS